MYALDSECNTTPYNSFLFYSQKNFISRGWVIKREL